MRGLAASVCAWFHYALSIGARRNVAGNLAGAGRRPPSRGAVLGVFRQHANNIIEMFASSASQGTALPAWCTFDFEGREELDRALAAGKGAILVTAHVGSWELGALSLRALGYDLHVVAGIQMNRFLTGAVKDAKERRGIQVINPEDSYRKLLKALAAGGVVALLVDGNVYTGGKEVVFFGARVRMPGGPVRLAKASGAPIVGGYCRRVGNGAFKVHLERIADAGAVEELGEDESLARVYGAVERFIGENTDQWCMFRRFWDAPERECASRAGAARGEES